MRSRGLLQPATCQARGVEGKNERSVRVSLSMTLGPTTPNSTERLETKFVELQRIAGFGVNLGGPLPFVPAVVMLRDGEDHLCLRGRGGESLISPPGHQRSGQLSMIHLADHDPAVVVWPSDHIPHLREGGPTESPYGFRNFAKKATVWFHESAAAAFRYEGRPGLAKACPAPG